AACPVLGRSDHCSDEPDPDKMLPASARQHLFDLPHAIPAQCVVQQIGIAQRRNGKGHPQSAAVRGDEAHERRNNGAAHDGHYQIRRALLSKRS
nr:hypothetical protein [Tanacetum cinerariifolium]